jgi:glyoxylase-like metal-dependent hydrolase (beta-lactamase superfamily II)
MVGYRNPESLLQCNTYVRAFRDEGDQYNVCLDPGSQFDFSVIESNVEKVVGGLNQIHGFTVNHQDPDVVANSPQFCDANPAIDMVATEEVWRLLQHMLFKPGHLRLANANHAKAVNFGKSHKLQLVPTPFCHFRGAMAFYDPEIRTLFTGDLFGGFNRIGAAHLWAQETDWPGIAQFHQIYMPCRDVLRHAVREILSLKPTVEILAPQHGHVISGDLVPLFLERMHELLVGHDLVAAAWDEEKLSDYQELVSRLLARAELTLGRGEVQHRLTSQDVDDDLIRHVRFEGHTLRLQHDGYSAVVKIFSRLTRQGSLEFVIALRSIVLATCTELGLPIPPVGAGLEDHY